MKLPRDISGEELARLLERQFGYRFVRMKGSHTKVALTSDSYRHSLTIPRHRQLRVGTLDKILADLAEFHCISKEEARNTLFD